MVLEAIMRTESLRYFLEVARCNSFTQAANHLFITQQGLSRAVKALEDSLSTTLFKRHDKRVQLTSAGETLVPYAQTIVSCEQEMRKELARSAEKKDRASMEASTVEIPITPFVSAVFLNLMKEKVEHWGLAEATFTEWSFADIVRELESGELGGSALVLVPINELLRVMQSSSILFVPLLSLDIVALCPTNLVSPRRRVLSLKEVAKLPLAYNSEPLFAETIRSMTKNTTLENVVLVSSSLEAIERTVAAGRACSLGDSLVAYLRETTPNTITCAVKGSALAFFGILESTSKPSQTAQHAYMKRFEAMIKEELCAYTKRHPLSMPHLYATK